MTGILFDLDGTLLPMDQDQFTYTYFKELAVKLAGGGKLYYVATMIPTGAEDDARIRRHLLDRAGMGFETVECFRDLGEIQDRDAAFLVDNITSLMQNALFPAEKGYEMDLSAAKKCIARGTDVVIANGSSPAVLYDIVDGKKVGTRFISRK